MGVLVVEDTECYGRQEASKIQEERCGDEFVNGLVPNDAVAKIAQVVRESPFQVSSETTCKPSTL